MWRLIHYVYDCTFSAILWHKTPSPSDIVIDREQGIIQNYPLQDNLFSRNTNKVLEILKELTVDTYAETLIKGKRFGQEAMLELQNNYDVKSEGKRRKIG